MFLTILGALISALLAAFAPPAPRFVGPARRYSRGSNKPIRRIVIHSTVGPTKAGSARSIGGYFRSSSARGSAHYIVDAGEVVQSVWDSVVAWHAPPNPGSIGVELCDYPTNAHGRRWNDADHRAMFDLAVDLVADLCLSYDVPPWFVGTWGLRAGRRGVTTHNLVSKAFGQSSHWDPGHWPRRRFMRAVRAAIKAKKQEAAR